MIGISACLGGIYCRYDGGTQEISQLKALVKANKAILICPEVLGGLPTPRKPAEIVGGDGFDVWENKARVITCEGQDVTKDYQLGAKIAFEKLQAAGVTQLILKENSPSCGSHMIYDGSFSGGKISGVGVATAYFILQKMAVFSETQLATIPSLQLKEESSDGN